MAHPKKRTPPKTICAQIKRADSVEALSKIIRAASPRTTGFQIDPDTFDDIELEKLAVVEALVVRLREVIEADGEFRKSMGLKPLEEEEEINYDYGPDEEEEEEDADFEYKPDGDQDETDDEQ